MEPENHDSQKESPFPGADFQVPSSGVKLPPLSTAPSLFAFLVLHLRKCPGTNKKDGCPSRIHHQNRILGDSCWDITCWNHEYIEEIAVPSEHLAVSFYLWSLQSNVRDNHEQQPSSGKISPKHELTIIMCVKIIFRLSQMLNVWPIYLQNWVVLGVFM